MEVQSFSKSLVFGGMAAVALFFTQQLLAPILGSGNVLTLYLAGILVTYAAWIGMGLREKMTNALIASLGAITVFIMTSGIGGVAIGLTLVLALVRTGLASETRTARALCAEGTLGLGALLFADHLASPGWLGDAAAIWGFALVQSLYFLLPVGEKSSAGQGASAGTRDPFERAREQILSLLEEA
jgi:hypothetical protein